MNTLSVCGDFNNCKIINRFVYEFKKKWPKYELPEVQSRKNEREKTIKFN